MACSSSGRVAFGGSGRKVPGHRGARTGGGSWLRMSRAVRAAACDVVPAGHRASPNSPCLQPQPLTCARSPFLPAVVEDVVCWLASISFWRAHPLHEFCGEAASCGSLARKGPAAPTARPGGLAGGCTLPSRVHTQAKRSQGATPWPWLRPPYCTPPGDVALSSSLFARLEIARW